MILCVYLQDKSLEALYTMVKDRIDKNRPPLEIRLEYGGGVNLESKSDKLIHKELFDSATYCLPDM